MYATPPPQKRHLGTSAAREATPQPPVLRARRERTEATSPPPRTSRAPEAVPRLREAPEAALQASPLWRAMVEERPVLAPDAAAHDARETWVAQIDRARVALPVQVRAVQYCDLMAARAGADAVNVAVCLELARRYGGEAIELYDSAARASDDQLARAIQTLTPAPAFTVYDVAFAADAVERFTLADLVAHAHPARTALQAARRTPNLNTLLPFDIDDAQQIAQLSAGAAILTETEPFRSGGFGLVFRARRARDDDRARETAFKTYLHFSTHALSQRRALLHEALVLMALPPHDHVVAFEGADVAPSRLHDTFGIHLRLARYSLADLLALLASAGQSSYFSGAHFAKQLIDQIGRALAHLHAHGVVHSDLKPQNVLVDDPAASVVNDSLLVRHVPQLHMRLADFGSAVIAPVKRALDKRTPIACSTTLKYAAPGVEACTLHAEDDVYALGACACEVVTGREPHGDLLGDLRALDEIPQLHALQRLILLLTQRERSQRPRAREIDVSRINLP
jgi:hypothetical protein